MDLVKFLSPKNVILVHGEKPKMDSLKEKIQSELGIQCYVPANGETLLFPSTVFVKAHASDTFIHSCLCPNFKFSKGSEDKSDLVLKNTNTSSPLLVSDDRVSEGILVMESGKMARVVHQDELLLMLGDKKHQVQFAYCSPVHADNLEETRNRDLVSAHDMFGLSKKRFLIQLLFKELSNCFSGVNIQNLGDTLQVESLQVSICLKDSCPYRIIDNPQKKSAAVFFCCTWSAADAKLAWEIISTMEKLNLSTN